MYYKCVRKSFIIYSLKKNTLLSRVSKIELILSTIKSDIKWNNNLMTNLNFLIKLTLREADNDRLQSLEQDKWERIIHNLKINEFNIHFKIMTKLDFETEACVWCF